MQTASPMASTTSSNLLRSEAELLLEQARQSKSQRIKNLGDPINLAGKALGLRIDSNYAWIAENTAVARKIDLESGKTVQLYKGHSGPVTCLAFCDRVPGSGDHKILITGSWDQTIKLWNTDSKGEISSTNAHNDFVKTLFVIQSLNLLVSGSSDKTVRFWDLSNIAEQTSLKSVGAITSHTRPVECIDGYANSDSSAVIYTADTMGAIKVWNLSRNAAAGRWDSLLRLEVDVHRTRVNELICGSEQLWTASSDETVQISAEDSTKAQTIVHPTSVRCLLPLALSELGEPYLITGAGDVIYVYEISTLENPELIGEIDGHWHDVIALRLWMRKWSAAGRVQVEPYIVSTSLDGTIRKWRLQELLTAKPKKLIEGEVQSSTFDRKECVDFKMSEEEERELAELLESE